LQLWLLTFVFFRELFGKQHLSPTTKFSEEDVRDFARLSGDMNPIHIDPDAAARSIFGKPVVHGMLLNGLISAAIGMDLPGEGAIYIGQDSSFKAPVFYDEEITVEVEVQELREEKRIAKLSTNCYKADGTLAVTRIAVVKLSQ
jgi:enoyl-CoA hydratase